MNFQTPPSICQHMASMLPIRSKLVLEPTPGDGNLVKALIDAGLRVHAPDDFWTVDDKYDAIVMNPPFSPMQLGYKILSRCMEMSDVVVALMPWLTIINSEKRTRQIMDFGLRSVTHLPRNAFKGSRVQTCILEMNRWWKGSTLFSAYKGKNE